MKNEKSLLVEGSRAVGRMMCGQPDQAKHGSPRTLSEYEGQTGGIILPSFGGKS
jgi:hypothetical protein